MNSSESEPPLAPPPKRRRIADAHAAELIAALREAEHRLSALRVSVFKIAPEVDVTLGQAPLLRERTHFASEREEEIVDALPANIVLLDSRGKIVAVNDGWRRFGATNGLTVRDQGIGSNYLDACDKAQGDDSLGAVQVAEGIRSVLAGTALSYSMEYPCNSPAEQRWFLLKVTPLDGSYTGVVVMHVDITARKLTELALRDSDRRVKRLNRVYEMLNQVNALLFRTARRDEIFHEACRMAVELGGFRLAWIGLVDKARDVIRPVASAGDVKDFFDAAPPGIFVCSPGGPGRAGQAVRTRQAQVSNDFRYHQNLMKREMEARDIRAFAIIPLLVADEAIGVFALYSEETGFFDEYEMRLFLELAANLSRAVEKMETRERLEYLASYDPLTGLANCALFLDRVAQHLRDAAENGRNLALLLIDVERFSNVNDSLGRPAGDALLRQLADWLVGRAGDGTLLTRVGGGRFALVMPRVSPVGNLAGLVENLMEALANHSFEVDRSPLWVACKVGVAVFPTDGDTAELLFQHAESALSSAKAGGDPYLFYSTTMTAAVAEKLTLASQLRGALDNDEFVLLYQPKVGLVDGNVTSVEALIRWNDPRTGMVAPDQFIPVLEESGLIHEVGRWAMRQAIKDYLRWCDAGLPGVRIAVNVSSLQLRNRGFVADIERALAVDPRAAAGLELEITESMFVDITHGIASLAAIRALGVSIALDDFGTGFSSLSYLSRLPFDTLKIDRSFVTDMTDTPAGLAIVSTIISLAHSLKRKVVAEGAETEEQSRLLRLLGCDEMQGYFFARPMPCDRFESDYLAFPAS